MELSGMEKFLGALKVAKIDKWCCVTDMSGVFHNNDDAVNVLDADEATIYNFSKGQAPTYSGVRVQGAHLADIHEVRFEGDFKKALEFAKAYGIELTEEQKQKIIKIDRANITLKPITGDYFRKLTDEELAELSPEDRKKYEAELEKRKFRSPQVTVY